MRTVKPHRRNGPASSWKYARLWKLSIGLSEEQAIPALPLNIFIILTRTQLCVIYRTPVITQCSVVLTRVDTLGDPIYLNAVRAWSTFCFSAIEDEIRVWKNSAHVVWSMLLLNLSWQYMDLFELFLNNYMRGTNEWSPFIYSETTKTLYFKQYV